MPLRDTPGKSANACPSPIMNARPKPTSFTPFGMKRVPISTVPVNISKPPTILTSEKNSSTQSPKKKCTITAGNADSRIFAQYLQSFDRTIADSLAK